jgi:hypothetical protein
MTSRTTVAIWKAICPAQALPCAVVHVRKTFSQKIRNLSPRLGVGCVRGQTHSRENNAQERLNMTNPFLKCNRLALAAMLFAGVTSLPAIAQSGSPEAVGTFHGQVHATSGKVAVYSGANSEKTLRLTEFKTSNGPDVHVILIAADDAKDNDNFLNKTRVALPSLNSRMGRWS